MGFCNEFTIEELVLYALKQKLGQKIRSAKINGKRIFYSVESNVIDEYGNIEKVHKYICVLDKDNMTLEGLDNVIDKSIVRINAEQKTKEHCKKVKEYIEGQISIDEVFDKEVDAV